MKEKFSNLFDQIFKDKLWRIVVFGMFIVLLGGTIYYLINFPTPSRAEIFITAKEFKNNKINEDLSATDEVVSSATFEDYKVKLNALKSKLPKAEWKITQRELTEYEFDKELKDYFAQQDRIAYLSEWGINASAFEIPYPSRIKTYPYSMKGFLDDVFSRLNIDSTDFDSKISVLEKIDHFYNLTDKKGADTILVKSFKEICANSKDLTIDEIKSVEKLHKSVTNTKFIFSLKQKNTKFERQVQLFGLYEAAANNEITEERFEFLSGLVPVLKKQTKDTIAILDVLKSVINIDLDAYKLKDEKSDELELECAKLFFDQVRFKYDSKNIVNDLNKYVALYGLKLKEANLEKRAREILRKENRDNATDYMYFGFFFLCICVIIIQLIKQNNINVNK